MNEPIDDEWSELPIMLTVEEAARVLRVGRSKAYEMAALYTWSGGTQGLPVLRLGTLLRVPKFALYEYVTTGRIVQLIAQPDANAIDHAIEHATASRKSTRTRRTSDHAQLSLLGSD